MNENSLVNRLFICALKYRITYESSNPEIGFGPSYSRLLNEIEQEVNIKLEQLDRQLILNEISKN